MSCNQKPLSGTSKDRQQVSFDEHKRPDSRNFDVNEKTPTKVKKKAKPKKCVSPDENKKPTEKKKITQKKPVQSLTSKLKSNIWSLNSVKESIPKTTPKRKKSTKKRITNDEKNKSNKQNESIQTFYVPMVINKSVQLLSKISKCSNPKKFDCYNQIPSTPPSRVSVYSIYRNSQKQNANKAPLTKIYKEQPLQTDITSFTKKKRTVKLNTKERFSPQAIQDSYLTEKCSPLFPKDEFIQTTKSLKKMAKKKSSLQTTYQLDVNKPSLRSQNENVLKTSFFRNGLKSYFKSNTSATEAVSPSKISVEQRKSSNVFKLCFPFTKVNKRSYQSTSPSRVSWCDQVSQGSVISSDLSWTNLRKNSSHSNSYTNSLSDRRSSISRVWWSDEVSDRSSYTNDIIHWPDTRVLDINILCPPDCKWLKHK